MKRKNKIKRYYINYKSKWIGETLFNISRGEKVLFLSTAINDVSDVIHANHRIPIRMHPTANSKNIADRLIRGFSALYVASNTSQNARLSTDTCGFTRIERVLSKTDIDKETIATNSKMSDGNVKCI